MNCRFVPRVLSSVTQSLSEGRALSLQLELRALSSRLAGFTSGGRWENGDILNFLAGGGPAPCVPPSSRRADSETKKKKLYRASCLPLESAWISTSPAPSSSGWISVDSRRTFSRSTTARAIPRAAPELIAEEVEVGHESAGADQRLRNTRTPMGREDWRDAECNRVKNWSGKRDLNPRPSPWQGDALPLSYSRSLK